MFDTHSITLNNFKCYAGEHNFNFPAGYGLYYLTGENKAQPKLESNGSGKSTLLDAITWVLYGKTTRALKAGEVITWGTKNCVVSLRLTVGDRTLTVKRSQKPNGIWVDGTPIDQDALEKLIVLNYECFLYSVLHSQFGRSFLTLSPAEKLTLFSDLLGLDFWTKKSELAADTLAKVNGKLNELDKLHSYYKTTISNLVEEIKQLDEKSRIFEQSRDQKLKELTDKLRAAVRKAPTIPLELYDNVKVKQHNRDIYLENMQEAAQTKAAVKAELKLVTEHYEQFGRLGYFCHTCNQEIDQHLAGKHKTELSSKISTLESKLDRVSKSFDTAKDNMFQLNLQIDEAVEQLNNKKFEVEKFKQEQARMDSLRNEYFKLKDEYNPYDKLWDEKEEFLNRLTENKLENKNEITELEHDKLDLEYWVKGFKGIRLYIIENAFRTLELEVNNSLAQLGMEDWSITFDVERENKSGGITRGFVVFVKGPNNTEPVRWESWSGGESQRLQLAANIGLSNLIMHQNGLNGVIEFWDEPSTSMSAGGVVDLANMLSERAHNEARKVWIVDHVAAANFGEFTGIVTVKKDRNGSSSITEGN